MGRNFGFHAVVVLIAAGSVSFCAGEPAASGQAGLPQAADARLQVELFASAPDIVHPIGMDCDSRGRLLVIESHTHFRPANYQGPSLDRIRLLEDSDGDGKADRFTTFFEGTRATMDIAVHSDNSVYLATRNEILRLRDTDGDGKADERRRIVFLDTPGDYPHNGLSGLAFDARGNLFFGMGENLGATYKLTGADGKTIRGEGDGGHIFWCTADGRDLRRVATGFWNPFGVCRDIFGRIFAVDNDPDASPPCRMVNVVEGGDFGFQFRYGRSGRHPFQSWDGQLPGTLPMTTGVGEAPCEILSYESDGSPPEYLGSLLVASWADHRVERYDLKDRGASYGAERKPLLQGGKDFRPVGLTVHPDGSLFVSDWMRRDYNLHGQGAIWHVRRRDAKKPDRPADPRQALFSRHRPLREAAATKLAANPADRDWLRSQAANSDARIRAACLTALIDADDRQLDLKAVADADPLVAIRAMAICALAARGDDVARFLAPKQPGALRLAAAGSLRTQADAPQLLVLLSDSDPFLRNAAVRQLAQSAELLRAAQTTSNPDRMQRIGLLLAWRASGLPDATKRLSAYLADRDEDVRFLAAKWIADEKVVACRSRVFEALKDPGLNIRMYLVLATALARLDGQAVSETKMADHFVTRLADRQLAPNVRARMLQLVPTTHAQLNLDLLSGLLKDEHSVLQREAVRALAEHPKAGRFRLLLEAAKDPHLGADIRAEAILGLSDHANELRDDLFRFLQADSPAAMRNEALRTLTGVRLGPEQQAQLEQLAKRHSESAALVARVLGRPFVGQRPPAGDLDAWLKKLDGPADALAGRRVFFHSKLTTCFRCHRVEGRGREIGPDLSTAGNNSRRHIVESIVQPSNLVAPHYQSWSIETSDGKLRTGMLVSTYLDEYSYLDSKGDLFKVSTPDVVDSRPLSVSIMPDGLVNLLTDQELRDLVAYLVSLK